MKNAETQYPLLGGTDGFRDVATLEYGPGRMNSETVAGLTYALVGHQREQGLDGPVVVAQDTRPSGPSLRQAAIAGARAAHAEVVDLATLPTPGAQRTSEQLGALATVVITASHNPAHDNGWKGMMGHEKPSPDAARAISDRFWRQVESGLTIPETSTYAPEDHEASETYIRDIVSDITAAFGREPLAGKLFVVDGANGAARRITPEVFRRLGARVEEFSCDGSGLINEGCGAANLDGVKTFLASRPDIVKDPDFVGVVANDGDADRVMGVGIVDDTPVEITGNHIMEALATYPRQPGIVGTIYTNSATKERLRSAGIGFEYCPNGDVFVTEALLAKQAVGKLWTRGGEFTGHLIDTQWLQSGDGVRMAAWFAAWAASNSMTFGDIHREMPMLPEKIVKLKLDGVPPADIEQHPLVQAAIQQEVSGGYAKRFIVRPSGTENGIVRVWGEGGANEAQINSAVHNVAATVLALV